MGEIGKKTVKKAVEMVDELLTSNLKEIDETFDKTEEALKLPLSIYLSRAKNGVGVRVRATLSFATDYVKDSKVVELDEKQREIPFPKDDGTE